MKQRFLAWLTRQLWPHIETHLQDALITHERKITDIFQDGIAERADQRACQIIEQAERAGQAHHRRFIGQ